MKFNIEGNEVEIPDADLTKAIEDKADKIDVKMEGVTIRTTEQESTFVENTKKLGFADGAEIGRKNVLKGMGLEANGAHKSDDTAIKALTDWSKGEVDTALTDAKIEPNDKIKTLNSDLEGVRANLLTSQQETKDAVSNHNAFKLGISDDKTAMSFIPDNTIMSKERTLLTMKSEVPTKRDENNVLVGLDSSGNVLKDAATLAPLPMSQVYKNYFDNNTDLLKSAGGGGGGGDSSGNEGKTTFIEFAKEMAGKNIEMNSTAWNTEVATRQKNGTLES